MRFLIDCNVLSELRKGQQAAAEVRDWLASQEDSEFAISVITLGEIAAGIAQVALRDTAQATHLERWKQRIEQQFDDRILPVTASIADRWGRLCPRQPLPTADGLLAATALEHDLICVTRNVRDFERAGVRLLNPFLK